MPPLSRAGASFPHSKETSDFVTLIVCGFAFDPPKAGKIAIKVINHYGDEVLKVYEAK